MSALDLLCVNTIRTLAIDAVQKANSGHPGMPLGAAPMAYVLWQRYLRHNPADPRWPDRDRFVLSGGHASALLYSLLHLTGYALSLDDLKAFRQWQSLTPGHPEALLTPGVEATSGPLGQGFANAVGMAIAERTLAHLFNRPGFPVIDHHTYVLASDGDMMEGVASEAASLAGHLKLGKLVVLYDANDVSLDGPCSLAFSEDVAARFAAYGWHTQAVAHGDTDLDAIARALDTARRDTARPSLIVVKTTIGFGSPHKAGTAEAHGSPLGADEVKLTKRALGWDPERQFYIPPEARAQLDARQRGVELQRAWQDLLARYQKDHPEPARLFAQALLGELPQGWDRALPAFKAGEALATRVASGQVLNAVAQAVPYFLGGDADLSVSTNTSIKEGGSFNGQTGAGRNLHYGVREHAMGSAANGMAYHGGVRTYVSTFFVFSDYMRPAVRLAALNHLPVIYVWTHDSVALGEDGPTHQPVEQLASLRAMPNLVVLRPADAHETVHAWRVALARRDGPTALVLTRQKVPVLSQTSERATAGVPRGAYVLAEPTQGPARALVIATGSEVHLALAAQVELHKVGVPARVVSMPSCELFAAQDAAYRDSVLPPAIHARVVVEAAASFGWQRWVGDAGRIVAIDRFGASAPGEELLVHYGITTAAVVRAVNETLKTKP